MKNLPLSSLLLILFLLACSPAKHLGLVWDPPFSGTFDKALFKTSFDIRKIHLSGYTMIKKTDSAYHIVFSNEIGMTIYDFELYQKYFKVNYLFEPMNKKAMVRIFERDFRLLIYGQVMSGQNFINKAEISFETGETSWPGRITITNPGIQLRMQLRHMNL